MRLLKLTWSGGALRASSHPLTADGMTIQAALVTTTMGMVEKTPMDSLEPSAIADTMAQRGLAGHVPPAGHRKRVIWSSSMLSSPFHAQQ